MPRRIPAVQSKSAVGSAADDDPLWFKDAIIYELHVRSFRDSVNDGVGDFRGLTEKLDYLQDLGVTAIWLLPFYPSPLRDDGYDIADYYNVHPAYGTLKDFQVFLREAHRRGLKVITELVINHTSDQHPWFRRSRRDRPGGRWRDWYVWTDDPERYKGVRIIFKDFEPSNWSWDPLAKAYYWHRFFSHQPDLNFDNPRVRREIFRIVDFWLGMGVDGMRLDAVPYLFEREGTSCENLPETHAFLKELRAYVDRRYRNRMLLAEANQWPEDAAAYFAQGDESHMNFHFPLMPRLFMAVHMEDRHPIVDIMAQTPPIPENCQWALFLRNHDELTLEMVTDAERDYMYRAYARDERARINLGIRHRLAPLLGNHRRKIELMTALLFSMPGTPVIYYGDEIGMGDNIYLGDRNGVRTPMQWSADRNAGFSRANPQKLFLPVIIDPEYHYESVNVEAQQANPHSLLWWTKRLIALRKQHKVFGRGSLEFLEPENRKVLVFLRHWGDEHVLVVANLSRFTQYAELDLSAYRGWTPVEMFGRVRFPVVGEAPYFITIGPHSFYWFLLEPERAAPTVAPTGPPLLRASEEWTELVESAPGSPLERALAAWVRERRWFSGKSRSIRGAMVLEAIPLGYATQQAQLLLVRVDYYEGDPDTYLVPLTWIAGPAAETLLESSPGSVVARVELRHPSETGLLYDALADGSCAPDLLSAIGRNRRFRGRRGVVTGLAGKVWRSLAGRGPWPRPVPLRGEQSNSSLLFGDRAVLKVYRRLEPGTHVEVELGRYLTEQARFPHTAPYAGTLEYQPAEGEPMTLAVVHGYVKSQGDAWSYTLDALSTYFESAVARMAEQPVVAPPPLLRLGGPVQPPPLEAELIGVYLESARLLGRRTGELHQALAQAADDPALAPEPFTPFYQRSLYQGMVSAAGQALRLLRRQLSGLPPAVQQAARELLEREGDIRRRFQPLRERSVNALRIRCHGDYHLGQVLYTGSDFVIIDLEGEPSRPMSERRIKRSCLRDVAGMLRSFHYAASASLLGMAPGARFRPEDMPSLLLAARCWQRWVGVAFLSSYLDTVRPAGILPGSTDELHMLLDAFILEKNCYELVYELNHRPDWVAIPIEGMLQTLENPV